MPVLLSLYYSHHASLVKSLRYLPHTDHSEDVLKHFACWIGENLLLHWGAHLVLELGHAFLIYCSSNDYTEIIPDVIHCPNKDARARSDRLQLGTAHIQSFTQTRQVSVVMGMTRFWAAIGCYRLSGLGSHRHASSGFVFGTDWPDSSVLTWPRPYICLSFYTHRAV